mmetsp:Transcript_50704/g.144874  ORF Transcript_50704/g.144874 Transcript_50704/m.144874 type:complete len:339 (-) Transcript_50704:61-1077(-)
MPSAHRREDLALDDRVRDLTRECACYRRDEVRQCHDTELVGRDAEDLMEVCWQPPGDSVASPVLPEVRNADGEQGGVHQQSANLPHRRLVRGECALALLRPLQDPGRGGGGLGVLLLGVQWHRLRSIPPPLREPDGHDDPAEAEACERKDIKRSAPLPAERAQDEGAQLAHAAHSKDERYSLGAPGCRHVPGEQLVDGGQGEGLGPAQRDAHPQDADEAAAVRGDRREDHAQRPHGDRAAEHQVGVHQRHKGAARQLHGHVAPCETADDVALLHPRQPQLLGHGHDGHGEDGAVRLVQRVSHAAHHQQHVRHDLLHHCGLALAVRSRGRLQRGASTAG